MHDTPLIATIVAGLGLAFVLRHWRSAFDATPCRLSAGRRRVGPFTPGFVANQALATELAEIGVILLMFGVGLHFSLKDLLSVRAIAVPGAVVQIAVATPVGLGLALVHGLDASAPVSSSASRCRSPPPWCCCAPSRSATDGN